MAIGKKKPDIYYHLDKIKERNATYNIIFGERSNGKSFACLEEGLKNYIATGETMALVRRWLEDFTGKRGSKMFANLESEGVIEKITGGEWTNVYYYGSRWYLCRYEDNGKTVTRITDDKPFCTGFALSAAEHDKSTSYPDVTTIVFDEMLTRGAYLPDEFVIFMNVLSTIIRHRTNVKIYMLGNTVNKFCPYFHEMGLKHVKQMKPGDIDLYTYGDSGLTVAVEYSDTAKKTKGKASDVYFAFDNPKLQMITGGAWEIDLYPHCPCKYTPKNVLFTYFICFDGEILQCEIIRVKDLYFTFVHPKTTPLKDDGNDLIYTTGYDVRRNYGRKLSKPLTPLQRRVADSFFNGKVYYSDNETGEIMRNYLLWCKTADH